PEAQMSLRTGFILQGNSENEEIINTNKSWKAAKDKSTEPLPPQLIYSYYVAGPGEKVNMHNAEEGWMRSGFSDGAWQNAQEILHGLPKGVFDLSEGWMLVPRSIPPMELREQRLATLRRADGLSVPAAFPQKKTPVTVPPNTTATLLLDQGHLTNAYPVLAFSNGKDAVVSLSYAEALYINEGEEKDWRAQNKKGNRNEVEGKRFVGREDQLLSNGKEGQSFTPLSWRTFRYIQLTVQTKNEPLRIDDLYSHFTGYPFQQVARFSSGNDTLSKILEVGWRTARLCAMETYMDCPYYEQLQYVGDTRIQALVSLYNSGDDRLVRNAISQIDNSRLAEGVTLSRFPTASPQEIPPFSLWYIGMLHDWWRYRPDAKFVKEKLAGMRQVLNFFSHYQQADGSLKNPPYWNFTDWANGKGTSNGWDRGVAPMGKDRISAALDLQLLWAYQLAAELETALGLKAFAEQYRAAGNLLKQTIRQKYWNGTKGLFADTPEKDQYSQHVNALAILTGVTVGEEAKALAQKIMTDTSLTQATVYFKYYTHQALVKAGFGNDYLNWLDTWKENLRMGMTTWAEISDISATRSDCHAWGAHPNIELYRTVLGIDSDAPGFSRVKIEPHLGALKNVSGEIPHPNGPIAVDVRSTNNSWNIAISLPKNTPGYLLWKGRRYDLKPGKKNTLALP
ncbi:MAG TPA: alpha-L-rhamnosidase C-terminal domain-containing protein, partial [Flavisolibacter sp.]|nr:alpha-L-rhamnosidase C-terminal domain-containing protein [Flavisolibacter sp.]